MVERAGDGRRDVGRALGDRAPTSVRSLVRFLAALGRLSVRLLPEYLLLVVALGALRGVLFPVGSTLLTGTG